MAKKKPKSNKKRLEQQRALRVKYDAEQEVKTNSVKDVNAYFSALIDDFDDKLRPFEMLTNIDDKIIMLKQLVEEDGDTDRVVIIDSRDDNSKIIKAIRDAQSRQMEFVVVE